MNRNVPKLRFRGFDDEWKEKKLGELGESLIGLTYSPDDIVDKDNGILVLRSSNVQNGKLAFDDNVFVNCEIKEKIKVKNNDILICSRNGSKALIGKSALIKNLDAEATFGAFMTIFRCESGQFIHQLINTREFFKQINMNLGATINQITSNNLNNFKFSIPPLQEQEKIANFLTKVDSLIEEQDGKVQDLELYKKGMMQKIFSQEIRFKDDNGCEYPEWEEKSFSDILLVLDGDRGVNYPKEDDFFEKGYCLFLNAKNVTKTGFAFNEIKFINKEKDHILRNGKLSIYDVVLTTRGTVGNSALFDKTIRYENMRINSGMVILRANETEHSKFIYCYLKSSKFRKELNKTIFGSAQPQLTVKDIKKFKIPNPCLQEQTKIANFLSNIDSIIEEEKNKLEDLRQWKKGLLQQMFV